MKYSDVFNAFATLLLSFGFIQTSIYAAETYPSKGIKFIVPYAVGGLPDSVIRRVGQRLSERIGQPVIIDNLPGGGIVAGQALLGLPADGYTFIFSDSAMLSITPLVFSKVPYDVKKDFLPISYIAKAPFFLAVNINVPAKTFDEFIALAKSKPGEVSCGSSGEGSLHHLTIEAMQIAFGMKLLHVPYKGTGQSVPAVVAGQVDCVLAAMPSLAGFVATDRIRVLASASANVSSLAPNIRPMGQGIKDFDYAFLLGVIGKPGTPQSVVDKLNVEFAEIMKEPDIIQKLALIGVEPVGQGSEAFKRALDIDAESLKNTAKKAGITPK
jgi:tripartite-type tricarboxylate transporter receptor subunit TctC